MAPPDPFLLSSLFCSVSILLPPLLRMRRERERRKENQSLVILDGRVPVQ